MEFEQPGKVTMRSGFAMRSQGAWRIAHIPLHGGNRVYLRTSIRVGKAMELEGPVVDNWYGTAV